MKDGQHWTEWFRVITPVLLLCINLLAGLIISDLQKLTMTIEKIDNKLFTHLTNEEIHCPRTAMVGREEYKVYQEFRQGQMAEIRNELISIRCYLQGKYKVNKED